MSDPYDAPVVAEALKARASRLRHDLDRIEWSLSRLNEADCDLLAERDQWQAQRAALTPQLATLERAIRGDLTVDNNCTDDQVVGRVLMERANAAQREIDQFDWELAKLEVQRAAIQKERANAVEELAALTRAIDAIASRAPDAAPVEPATPDAPATD